MNPFITVAIVGVMTFAGGLFHFYDKAEAVKDALSNQRLLMEASAEQIKTLSSQLKTAQAERDDAREKIRLADEADADKRLKGEDEARNLIPLSEACSKCVIPPARLGISQTKITSIKPALAKKK